MDINFSVGRIVLLTYIILASSFCSNLFSNSLKSSIENNRMAQHLILLLLIMTLMIIFGNPLGIEITNDEQFNSILMSLLVYVWFIMTTKLDLSWNICVLIILTIYFIFESKKISEYNMILKDENINDIKKKELLDSFNHLQKYLLSSIFGVTLIGTYLYASDKTIQNQPQYQNQSQFGGGFNYFNFFFY